MVGDVDGRRAHPSNEVDAVRWVTPGEARGLLSYEWERQLLETLG